VARLLIVATGLCLVAVCNQANAETDDRHEFTVAANLDYVSTSGYVSWTNGSVGKLRYDESSDGLVLGRAYLDYRGRITDTLNACRSGSGG
jgi:hypothetical protein